MSQPKDAMIQPEEARNEPGAATSKSTTTLLFRAVVDDLREQQRLANRVLWQMALSNTAFHPGDTGTLLAVSRKGTRLEIPVLSVERDSAGRLWHIVEKPLAAGTDVTGEVNTPVHAGR